MNPGDISVPFSPAAPRGEQRTRAAAHMEAVSGALREAGAQMPFPALTQVLNGVVSLFVVHLDGLGVGAADAVADGVAPDHHVLVLGRGPAHHDAGDQRAHVQGAGHLGHTALCGTGRQSKAFSQIKAVTWRP